MNKDPSVTATEIPNTTFTSGPGGVSSIGLGPVPAGDYTIGIGEGVNTERWRYPGESPNAPTMDDLGFSGNNVMMGMGLDDSNFTWDMIGLGLEEPLPQQETIDELYVKFLKVVHVGLTRIQTPDILRQDTSFCSNDTQISISRCNESVSIVF